MSVGFDSLLEQQEKKEILRFMKPHEYMAIPLHNLPSSLTQNDKLLSRVMSALGMVLGDQDRGK